MEETGISESDRAAIDELREKLPPGLLTEYFGTDFNLLRWLRGFDYDLSLVVPKLSEHLRFRKGAKLDEIGDWAAGGKDVELIESYWPALNIPPADPSTNTTLFVDFLGAVDTPGITRIIGIHECTVVRTRCYETMLAEVMKLEAKSGRMAKLVYVIDLVDMPYTKDMLTMATGALKCLAYYLQENWVELMSVILVLNCPNFWVYLWALVKPLLPEKTREKTVILGTDWQKQMTKYVPTVNLPDIYGGSIATPSLAFPRVPSQRYWKDDGTPFGTGEEKLSIAAGSEAAYDVLVCPGEELAELQLRWLHSYECQVRLLHSPDPAETESDKMGPGGFRYCRLWGNPHCPNCMRLTAPRPGRYRLVFVNSYAWWSSLKVRVAARKITA